MSTDRSDLDPIDPRTAQQLYLDHKETECTDSTVRNHRYHTTKLVEWCDANDIENLNDLTGRHLQELRLWRKEVGDINLMTLNNYMCSLRVFLKWCASIEAVPKDLPEKVMVPRVPPEDQQADDTLDGETAQEILAYLSTFHYASLDHVLFALLWETGMRIGAVRSLDVPDVDTDEERVILRHRPDQGTTLKNGSRGERPVALTSELTGVIDDYVDRVRTDVTDEHDRSPLFTSAQGRRSRTSLRRRVYKVTSPCFRNEPCPDCTESLTGKCGEAANPHAVRRGSITHYLANDVPVEIVSDRMNVSRDVLDKHYDKRSEEVKLEQRRGYLDNV